MDPKISDLIDAKLRDSSNTRPWISFEFFPPKTEKGVESLKVVLATLKKYNPLFVDYTWGAGGSSSALTFDLCKMTKQDFGLIANMHLTCTNMDAELIHTALDNCKAHGIVNILALRGDPPVGQDRWVASDSSLACATDLTKYIRGRYGDYFGIAVAGYPEGHPAAMVELPASAEATLSAAELARCSRDVKITKDEATGTETSEPIINVCRDDAFLSEMDYLKTKFDAGAKFIVTQMFFDVEVYGTFVAACRAHGIMVPVVPGIMCISTYGGFKRMIKFCKTRVTQTILDRMEELKDDADAVKKYGIELGVQMCRRLAELGAPGLHFYTLNTSGVTTAILEGLGYEATETPETVFAGATAAATA